MKCTFLGGTLTFTACYFHINFNGAQSQKEIEFYDPNPDKVPVFGESAAPGTTFGQPGTYTYVFPVVVGESLHGEEISMFGVLSRRLTFEADFASTRGDYPDPDSPTGAVSSIAPPITLAVHGKYDFGNLRGDGFYITAGGTYYFAGWMYDEKFNFYQGLGYNSSQYVANVGIGYRWDHGRQSIYANCDNLLNQGVIASNADTGAGEYLPLRQAFVTYRFKF